MIVLLSTNLRISKIFPALHHDTTCSPYQFQNLHEFETSTLQPQQGAAAKSSAKRGFCRVPSSFQCPPCGKMVTVGSGKARRRAPSCGMLWRVYTCLYHFMPSMSDQFGSGLALDFPMISTHTSHHKSNPEFRDVRPPRGAWVRGVRGVRVPHGIPKSRQMVA